MTDRSPDATLRTRNWIIAAFVMFAMLGLCFGTWISRLPSMRDRLDASTLEMSIYGLCLAMGSLTGLVFSGRTVSWLGPRRTLLIGMLVQAAALIAGVTLLWFGLIPLGMVMLFVYGMAFGTCDVAINVSGAGAERELGRPRMPLFHGAFSLGGVVAMGIGAVTEVIDLPVPIHVAIMLPLIALISVIALRWIPADRSIVQANVQEVNENPGSVLTGPVPVISAPRPARGYNPWRDSRIYLIGLIALTMSLAEGTGSDWIALALVDGRGYSNGAGTLMVSVLMVTMLLVRVFGSPILTLFGRVAVIRGSALICALGVVVMILVPYSWAPILGTAFWGIGCGLGFPVSISASADNPETATKSVAAVSSIAYGAFLIGPMMIGFIGEHLGLLTAFWPLAGFLVLSVFFAGALRERGPSAAQLAQPAPQP